MKTYKLIIIFISISLFFIGLMIYNLMINNERTFSLISLPRYEMCFLISSDYKIQKTIDGFKYSMTNNYGEFKVVNSPLSDDLVKAKIGEVQAGYKKLKNDRIFEYKLDDSNTLRDRFYIIKKMQPNLVPLKSKCKDLVKRYPIFMEL